MIKVVITRSFAKTKQVASYEPINSFCSVQAEYEQDTLDDQFIVSLSAHLDNLARREVERTIESEMEKLEAVKKANTF